MNYLLLKLGTRKLLLLLSTVIFALSACESASSPNTIERDYIDPQILRSDILYNTSNNRSSAKALDQARVKGYVYFFLADTNNVKEVGYRLNNPDRSDAPFKVAGPNDRVVIKTTGLGNRTHLLSAEVKYQNGSSKVFTATFLVDNDDNLGDELLVSRNSYRNLSKRLNGASISQNDRVFIIPKEPVNRIEFYLDNDGSGSPRQTERYAFYDMGGTNNDGSALPISRQGGISGQHTVTAVIYRKSGQVVRKTASFSTGSAPAPEPEPTPEPSPPPAPEPEPEPEPTPEPDPDYGPIRNPSIPSGAVYISPGQNVNSVIKNRPEGTTFVLKTGVHRGQSIVLSRNSKLIGEYNAVLSGAKQVTSFSRSGSLWVLSNQTQQSRPYDGDSTARRCLDGYAMCRYGEQVFINNKPLKQVPSRDNLRSGQFYFDYGANKIYIADDPNGKTVEVSFYEKPLIMEPGSTVTNLIIEKYNTSPLTQSVTARRGSTFERNILRYNGGIAISVESDSVVKNNSIYGNTRLGVHGYRVNNVRVEYNEIAYNNGNGHYYNHEAGGVKFLRPTNLKLRHNYVHHNMGAGLWTDNDADNVLYENNRVADNLGHGIFHELGFAATIRNNVVERNKYGIYLTNSRDVKVYSNTVRDNTSGLAIRNNCREAAREHTTRNLEFYNNTVYQKAFVGGYGAWPSGKAAMFSVPPTCEYWSESLNDWYDRRGNRFYNNTYNLSGQASGTRPFFYWKDKERSYEEWKSFGQN